MSADLVKKTFFLWLISAVSAASVRDFVKITFIYRGFEGQAYHPTNINNVLAHPNFDRSKPTTIYSYGFTETIFQPSVRNVVDAYLENDGFNFLILSCDSIIDYTLFNANEISDMVVEGLLKMFHDGYSQFHLVGFSLGAQISGIVGRKIIKQSNGRHRIPRITGLDPGQLPPFINLSIELLNPSDADFVDVIHAETKYLGSAQSNGHSSFWVNGGRTQPMCTNPFKLVTQICSHLMAPKYWAASVRSKDTQIFPALKCSNYEEYRRKSCDSSIVNHMGLYTNRNLNGNFYLSTNHYPPYSREN